MVLSDAVQTRARAPKPDTKPKHRRSGSVSSISITADDLASPTKDRGALASPGSYSMKTKMIKRRTRSSLGGTEDFLKEFEIQVPSPGKKSELLTPRDLPQAPSKAGLASKATAPLPESSAVAVFEEALEDFPESTIISSQGKSDGLETYDVIPSDIRSSHESDLGLEAKEMSPAGEFLIPREEGVHPAGTLQHCRMGSDAGDPANHVIMGSDKQESGEEAGHSKDASYLGIPTSLDEGKSYVKVGLDGNLMEQHPPFLAEPVDFHSNGDEVHELVFHECEPALENVVVHADSFTKSRVSSEQQMLIESEANEAVAVMATDSATPSFKLDIVDLTRKRSLSKAEQEDVRKQEEKVSVQKRIEELERIAGGRPVHFRSQSLSLPRPSDVLHSRYHEAEVRQGAKLPQYKAPLHDSVVAEGSAECTETIAGEEFSQGTVASGNMASTERTVLPESVVHGCEPTEEDNELSIDPWIEDLRMTDEPGLKIGLVVDGPNSALVLVAENVPPNFEPMPVQRLDGAGCDCSAEVSGNKVPDCKEDSVRRLDSAGSDVPNLAAAKNLSDDDKVDVTHPVEKEIPTENPPNYIDGEETKPRVAAMDDQNVAVVKEDEKALDLDVVGSQLSDRKRPGDNLASGFANAVATGLPLVTESIESITKGDGVLVKAPPTATVPLITCNPPVERPNQDDDTSVLLMKQPAVDPLFVDSQLDRLWEMHSQELTRGKGESSGQEVRESSAQEDDPPVQYRAEVEVAPASCSSNGTGTSDKCNNKIDRPRTPLRSLLAEEEAAEKGSETDVVARGGSSQSSIVSPRGNLFRRIVSGGRNSEFSPKNQTPSRPFRSSCICCSPVK